jgi:hypothetical protein
VVQAVDLQQQSALLKHRLQLAQTLVVLFANLLR